MAKRISGYPWFTDGVSRDDEARGLTALFRIATNDLVLARHVLGLPWFTDDVTEDELQALYQLHEVALSNIELARQAAGLPWFTDGVTEEEWGGLLALGRIASADVELAREAMALSWFIDGMTGEENNGLSGLGKIAFNDLELARRVSGLPWFIDGVTGGEGGGLLAISYIANEDLELARQASALPWFIDGMTRHESVGLYSLSVIASNDLKLARRVKGLPWFTDDVTRNESDALSGLGNIVVTDIGLAREIGASPWFVDDLKMDLYAYALESLGSIARRPDDLAQLTALSWFEDGLNDEEAAFVVTLSGLEKAAYDDLLVARFTQTGTVHLPLVGDVRIWVFRNTPFPPDEDVLTIIEDSARILEGLLGVAFPTTDIIVLIVNHEGKDYEVRTAHHRTHVKLSRVSRTIPHEMAHYYLNDYFTRPPWVTEGGADFLEAYVDDRRGVQSLADYRYDLRRRGWCAEVRDDMRNLRHLIFFRRNEKILSL